jgi:hypothetical protein
MLRSGTRAPALELGAAATAAVVFCLVEAKPAWAYLDPGMGSYLFQMAVAGVLGVIFTFRTKVSQLLAGLKQRLRSRQE